MENEASRRINHALAFVCQNCGALKATAATGVETEVACVVELRVCSRMASASDFIALRSMIKLVRTGNVLGRINRGIKVDLNVWSSSRPTVLALQRM